ncbi:Ficolin-2 [Chelonia mydas]|uniref:Ficolin-2 n=1 Tax=Chelonia mydas TaxID=8469 RepID=M7ASQ6_CHEMY|nr:Ficolin-2 [Chelonia mydas]
MRGEKGTQGSPGKMGPAGEKGENGDTGVPGLKAEEELKDVHCKTGAKNCKELLARGNIMSGWYTIYPHDCNATTVLCDMDTDGGGWIPINTAVGGFPFLVLRHQVLRKFHLHNWNMAVDKLLIGDNELRIDLTDFDNIHSFAKYKSFKILGETENYKLILGDFLGGNAGDSLSGHNNMLFSTKDRQQDPGSNACATTYKGAWWYSSCHSSNLNGMYWLGAHSSFADGVNWQAGKGYNYSYKRSEMKFRPV